MSVNKKFQAAYDELMKVLNGDSATRDQLRQAAMKCSVLYEIQDSLHEKVHTLRQTNADLNRALRERSLEIEILEFRESSALRERSYDEWQKGADDTLKRLSALREQIEIERRTIHRRRRRELLILILAVIVANCVCLYFSLYAHF